MKPLIIAIDGPSGAGKGTVARTIALQLGYQHLDSGAMYRAIAWRALRDHLALDDEEAIARMAAAASIHVSDTVTIDDVDVTGVIRTPEIDRAAAVVARFPQVREVLVERQRALGARGGIVMEGRDIGTVVFPRADVKLYLDASPEERARRRAADPAHSAGAEPVSEVGKALEARDELDRTRTASPLAVAADAVVIDTSRKTIEEVVGEALSVIDRVPRSESVGTTTD